MGIIEEQATQVTEETELADSLTHMDSIPLSTDSMVTVRLSDPQPSALLVEPAEVVVPHHEAVAGRTELGADGIEDAHDLKSATKLMEVQAIDHQEGDVLYRTSAVSGHSKMTAKKSSLQSLLAAIAREGAAQVQPLRKAVLVSTGKSWRRQKSKSRGMKVQTGRLYSSGSSCGVNGSADICSPRLSFLLGLNRRTTLL
jgi:hypothetical protein